MAEVETSRDGAVLTITLNRPDVLNAFNTSMHAALRSALEEAEDGSVRAVVLTGAGRGFCVGQDLSEFQEAAGGHRRPPAEQLPPERARDPGAREAGDRGGERAGGGRGLSIACACDIRIASDAASFVPGVHQHRPDPGLGRDVLHLAAARLRARVRVDDVGPEAVGGRGARLGPRLGGRRGRRRWRRRAAELAAQYAAMPTRGVGLTKRLFSEAEHNTLEEQLELEAELQTAATQTADFREGVDAFLEKREPKFTGS